MYNENKLNLPMDTAVALALSKSSSSLIIPAMVALHVCGCQVVVQEHLDDPFHGRLTRLRVQRQSPDTCR
jgi:hypothetical protein